MITGLARAQAQYDSMEPEGWTLREEDRIDTLAGEGLTAFRGVLDETVTAVLDDIWADTDSEAVRDAVTEIVRDQILRVLK